MNVDDAAPTPTDVALANHVGGVAGKPETADAITFTFSEEMDPGTLYSGWGWGSTPDVTNAVVTFTDGGGSGTNQPDSLTVTGPSGVNLGTVTNLDGRLVTVKQGSYTFGATLHYTVTGGQSRPGDEPDHRHGQPDRQSVLTKGMLTPQLSLPLRPGGN